VLTKTEAKWSNQKSGPNKIVDGHFLQVVEFTGMFLGRDLGTVMPEFFF
jgi:hypothetical protein